MSSIYGIQCQREGFVERVKEEHGEGCNIHGSLEVNKVAGNFHFAPGKSFHHSTFNLIDMLALQIESYNVRKSLIPHLCPILFFYMHPIIPVCNHFLYIICLNFNRFYSSLYCFFICDADKPQN